MEHQELRGWHDIDLLPSERISGAPPGETTGSSSAVVTVALLLTLTACTDEEPPTNDTLDRIEIDLYGSLDDIDGFTWSRHSDGEPFDRTTVQRSVEARNGLGDGGAVTTTSRLTFVDQHGDDVFAVNLRPTLRTAGPRCHRRLPPFGPGGQRTPDGRGRRRPRPSALPCGRRLGGVAGNTLGAVRRHARARPPPRSSADDRGRRMVLHDQPGSPEYAGPEAPDLQDEPTD